MEYLGYVVSKHGVDTDPAKVQAVQEFPLPKDLKALLSERVLSWSDILLSERFITNVSVIDNPLYSLTCKNVHFEW